GIEKKVGEVTLADIDATTDVNESTTPVGVAMLLLGGSGLDAFIGAGGVGFELGDVNVGLALLGEQLTDAQKTAGKVARKWTTIQAEVGSAALVGVDGLTVGVETLSVSVNRQALDTSVVDYSLTAGSTTVRKTGLSILTGPASDMALTIDGGRGQFLEASGHLILDVFGFVQVDGEFAIEKATTPEALTLSDATTVNAEVLRIGASNLSAFAGMNGGTDEAIGLDLSGVEFGLALMSEVPAAGVTALPRSWTSVQATAESAAFVGVDGLTARGESIAVTVNRANELTGSVVDYSLKTEGGTERKTAMTVRTGITDSVIFDMDGSDGRLLRASAELELDLFGFFQVSGGFAIEKRSESFMLNDGVVSEVPADAKAATEINAELLTIGGSGIDAFAGMNGGTADAIGLNLSKVDFGLALITEVVADDAPAGTTARSFTTLKANAGEISFVGVEGLTASATELSVEINRGIAGTSGNADLVVDYSGRQLDVLAGPDATVTLDSDGSLGELTRAIGTLDINLFNFVSLNGNFTVESSSKEVHLAGADAATAGEVVQTDMLAIGGSNISAFVGLNGGSADAIGLQLTNAEFGLALFSSKETPTRSWTSLQASADELSFVGLEGLTASADTITISINQAGKDGDKVIDYAGANSTSLAIQTSQTDPLTLSLEGSEGETIKAAGNLDIDLFGFFSVKGGFAVEQRSQEVTLSDGSVIKAAELITIGANEVDAFAGINGGYNDTTGILNGEAMGLSLGTVTFGLALIGDPDDTTRSFTSLQATAGSASVVGIEGLTMRVNDMLVNINQGITLVAEPAKTIKVNTELKLAIPQELVGTLTFNRAAGTGYSADTAAVTITSTMTNDELLTALKLALESLDGIGAGNVTVTGNRYDGFIIEFINSLSGVNISDITVTAASAEVTYGVSTKTAANAGVNEVKEITITALREAPAPVSVTVSTETNGLAGVNEGNELIFTTPKSAGSYTVYLVADGLVQQTTTGVTGVSEVQRLSLTGDTTAQAGTATTTVTTVQEGSGSATVNERYEVTFKQEFGYQGFKLYFVDNPVLSPTWTYRNNAKDTADTIGQLKAAYAELLKSYTGGTADTSVIQVTVDTTYKGAGNRYTIEFIGTLAGVNVKGIGMRSEAGTFSNVNTRNGAAGTSEVQRVVVSATGAGNFTLSLTQGTQTYTTDGIAYGSNAATVRYALNAALGSAGIVEVTSSTKGDYLVTFGGALASTDVATLVATPVTAAPGGSFKLTFGSETTQNISYSSDGATLARRVQTALATLTAIGSGNVKVSYNVGQSNESLVGLDIRFTGTLASTNVSGVTVVPNLVNASATI
ncbi:MAG: hypothetical protein JZU70_05680, partial [Chlorobium sp.]|nr:hypothetical protein [Chlorobium sp.]